MHSHGRAVAFEYVVIRRDTNSMNNYRSMSTTEVDKAY